MLCPSCDSEVEAGAWICPRCDFILDASVLGGPSDPPPRARMAWSETPDDAPEAMILGDVNVDPEDFQVLPGAAADGDGRTTTFLFYTSGATSRVLRPDVVPIRESAPDVSPVPTTPYEDFILAEIDGKRTVREIQKSSGLAPQEVTITLLTLLDKKIVRITSPRSLPPAATTVEDIPIAKPRSQSKRGKRKKSSVRHRRSSPVERPRAHPTDEDLPAIVPSALGDEDQEEVTEWSALPSGPPERAPSIGDGPTARDAEIVPPRAAAARRAATPVPMPKLSSALFASAAASAQARVRGEDETVDRGAEAVAAPEPKAIEAPPPLPRGAQAERRSSGDRGSSVPPPLPAKPSAWGDAPRAPSLGPEPRGGPVMASIDPRAPEPRSAPVDRTPPAEPRSAPVVESRSVPPAERLPAPPADRLPPPSEARSVPPPDRLPPPSEARSVPPIDRMPAPSEPRSPASVEPRATPEARPAELRVIAEVRPDRPDPRAEPPVRVHEDRTSPIRPKTPSAEADDRTPPPRSVPSTLPRLDPSFLVERDATGAMQAADPLETDSAKKKASAPVPPPPAALAPPPPPAPAPARRIEPAKEVAREPIKVELPRPPPKVEPPKAEPPVRRDRPKPDGPAPDGHQMAKAAKLFAEALKDKAEGNLVSARMNMKLAMTFDSTNPLYEKAYEELTKGSPGVGSTASNVTRARELYDKATTAERLARHDEAIELLEQALEEHKDPAVYNRLGVLLAMKKNEFARAQELIEIALDMSPGNSTYQHNLSKVLQRAATHDIKNREGAGGGKKKEGLLGSFLGRKK